MNRKSLSFTSSEAHENWSDRIRRVWIERWNYLWKMETS